MKHVHLIISISLLCLVVALTNNAQAESHLNALQLAQKVASRQANDARVGYMHFTMRNNAGGQRKRSALVVHAQAPKQTKIGIYFTEPAGLRDTSFLSHDNTDSTDQNWLYLPATERVRKLPSSSRGDYFMGTDLSYGDIKDNFTFALQDWDFSLGELTIEEGKSFYVLNGTAKNEVIKHEIGYASFIAVIDPETWFPINIKYTDTDNTPLKEISILALDMIDDTWIATHFSVLNSQLSHQTDILITGIQYVPELPLYLLKPDELLYGAPVSLLKEGGE